MNDGIVARFSIEYPDFSLGVDLRLLESPSAAETATRDGARRLFAIQLGTTPTKLDAQLPATLDKALRRQVMLRALECRQHRTLERAEARRELGGA